MYSDNGIPTTVFRQLYSDNGVPTTVFWQRYSDRLCESPLLSSPFCVTISRRGLFRSTALNSCHKFALCHEQVRPVPKYGIKFLQQICLMPHIKVFRPRYSDKGTPTKVFPQRYSHKGIPTRCFYTLTNTLLRIDLIGWGIPKHNLGTVKLYTATELDNGSCRLGGTEEIQSGAEEAQQRSQDRGWLF